MIVLLPRIFLPFFLISTFFLFFLRITRVSALRKQLMDREPLQQELAWPHGSILARNSGARAIGREEPDAGFSY